MPRKQSEDLSRIPSCSSDFLQDITIELGRRLKSVRYQSRSGKIEFRVTRIEREEEEMECFDVTRWMANGSYIQVVVVENGIANYMFREEFEHKHDKARYTGFIATLKGWETSDIANLIADSLKNEAGIRSFWLKLHNEKKNQ
jgi:hypothetical protein